MSFRRKGFSLLLGPMVIGLVLRLPAHAAAAAPAAAVERTDAKGVVTDMERAVAFVAKSAKEAGLSAKDRKHQPFLSALKKTDQQVDALKKGLAQKNKDYFRAMHKSGAAIQGLQAAWPRTGVTNAKVAEGVKKLVAAQGLLRDKFSKEAVRRKKGGKLSAGEEKNFARMKARSQKALAQLQKLKANPKAMANKQLSGDVSRFITELNALTAAQLTVAAYVDSLLWLESFGGQWEVTYEYVVLFEPALVVDLDVVGSSVIAYEEVYWEVESDFVFADADWAVMDVAIEETVDIDVEVTTEEVATYEEYTESLEVEEHEYVLADSDADGTLDAADTDDDNDGITDDKDSDDDGDGIADGDSDADGTLDAADTDDDNDGITDDKDGDDDGDGIADTDDHGDDADDHGDDDSHGDADAMADDEEPGEDDDGGDDGGGGDDDGE